MKGLLYIALIFTGVFGCKSEDANVKLPPSVAELGGPWKLIAEEQGFVGQSAWVDVKQDSAYNIIFRSDGLLLNAKGLPACCAPTSLTINGIFFEIKPSGQLAPNPECTSVKCTNCPLWDIQIAGSEMTITKCKDVKRKYLRI